MTLPKRLERDTIGEAVFELRFHGIEDRGVQLIPGMIQSHFPGRFDVFERTQFSEIPRSLVINDPNLQYAPVVRMRGNNEIVQVAHRAVSYAVIRPYPGWERFKARIGELVEFLREKGFSGKVERFSLKYLNIVPCEPHTSQLDLLDMDLRFGSFKPKEGGFSLRMESHVDDQVAIVTVRPHSTMAFNSTEELDGLMLDVDVICQNASSFFESHQEHLEKTHRAEKQVYFGLLKANTIQALGPEY